VDAHAREHHQGVGFGTEALENRVRQLCSFTPGLAPRGSYGALDQFDGIRWRHDFSILSALRKLTYILICQLARVGEQMRIPPPFRRVQLD
jgi:hypothetical protein